MPAKVLERRFADAGAKISRCPGDWARAGRRACTFAYELPEAKQCREGGPGGGDVAAYGVSCDVARQLRLPAGAGPADGPPGGGRAEPYRPWIAEGPWLTSRPRRPLGWTCLKFVEEAEPGIRHVCWDGRGGTVSFTVY